MTRTQADHCLALLRQADAILVATDETAIAAHLSLVIELLARRFPTPALLEFA